MDTENYLFDLHSISNKWNYISFMRFWNIFLKEVETCWFENFHIAVCRWCNYRNHIYTFHFQLVLQKKVVEGQAYVRKYTIQLATLVKNRKFTFKSLLRSRFSSISSNINHIRFILQRISIGLKRRALPCMLFLSSLFNVVFVSAIRKDR